MSFFFVRSPSNRLASLAASELAIFAFAFLSRLMRLFSAPAAIALRPVVRRRRYAGLWGYARGRLLRFPAGQARAGFAPVMPPPAP